MALREIIALCLLGIVKFDINGEIKVCKRNDFIINLLNKTGVKPERLAEIIMSD